MVGIAERLGDWPFLTVFSQLPPLLDEDGESLGIRAGDCGECHEEVYAEWQQSTHAAALHDLQYLAELAKPDSPKWLCLNCHIPVQNQRSVMIGPKTRLEDRGHDLRFLEKVVNPGFDPRMQQEAVTCATCHLRLDAQGRSVVVAPRANPDAAHPLRVDAKSLGQVCKRCHSPGPARLTPTFFCWFETAEELASGPWAGKANCIDCHMTGAHSDPKHKPQRHHYWAGGGVPKSFAAYDRLPERGFRPALEVKELSVEATKSKGTARFKVHYGNAHAGHWLPTADPERFLLLIASIRSRSGKLVAQARLRIGQTWDWGNLKSSRPARRLADNRLRPQEYRNWQFELALPKHLGDAQAEFSVLHVRLKAGNAHHMKSASVAELEHLRPGVSKLLPAMEKHYPLFSWIFQEHISLDSGKRSRTSLADLMALSKRSQNLSLDEIGALTRAEHP